MPKATKTKKHRWARMTYVPVAVAGYHDSGEPACFPLGDALEGINCMDCSEPITKDNAEEGECLVAQNDLGTD